jgi:hypothetical protein
VFAGARVVLAPGGPDIASGLLVGTLAAGPALVGLLCGEILTPFGFGRRAGAIGAFTAALGSGAVIAAIALAG